MISRLFIPLFAFSLLLAGCKGDLNEATQATSDARTAISTHRWEQAIRLSEQAIASGQHWNAKNKSERVDMDALEKLRTEAYTGRVNELADKGKASLAADPESALGSFRSARETAAKGGLPIGDLDAQIKEVSAAAARQSSTAADGAADVLAKVDLLGKAVEYHRQAGDDDSADVRKLAEARRAAGDQARALLVQAQAVVVSDARAAGAILQQAQRYADASGDGALGAQAEQLRRQMLQVVAVHTENEFLTEAPALMDGVTAALNRWLVARAQFSGDLASYEGYLRLRAFDDLSRTMSGAREKLQRWSNAGSSSAAAALERLESARRLFGEWRDASWLAASSSNIAFSTTLWAQQQAFLDGYENLRAAMNGRADIDASALSNQWHVAYRGTGPGGFTYTGTGPGVTGTGDGSIPFGTTGAGTTNTGHAGTGNPVTGNAGTGHADAGHSNTGHQGPQGKPAGTGDGGGAGGSGGTKPGPRTSTGQQGGSTQGPRAQLDDPTDLTADLRRSATVAGQP